MSRAALVAFVLSGCVTTSEGEARPVSIIDESRIVSTEQASRVALYEQTTTGHPMRALGVVSADADDDHLEDALANLRYEAAALGADAVVGVESHRGGVSGIAVSNEDPALHCSYDVLANLEVTVHEGNEGHALNALKRDARGKGADLVIGLHHVRRSDTLELHGQAIRYRACSQRSGS
jgi:uncharacterized protein YbjQ (UPF0145 family)